MDFSKMTLEQVIARIAELDKEVREAQDIEAVNKAAEEKKELLERRAELEAIEARKAAALALENGANGKVVETGKVKDMDQRTFAVDTAEYRAAWLKKLQGKELDEAETRAMTAGAVIPTITMDKIVAWLEKTPLVNAVDLTYIPGNVTYPAESAMADAAWVAMGSAASDGTDTLASVSLGAYKLIKTLEITADVVAMGIDAFEGWLVERLGNKIAKAVDAGILNGGGSTSGQCLGIAVSKTTQDGTYTKTTIKYADICKIIGALKSQYHQNASFVMPRQFFFGKVLGMTDSQGNRVVVADAQSPAKFNILGYPVIVDDNCTSGDILFGDLKAYKFNFAKAPEVTSDDSVGFRTGSRVYRALALADGKLADENAVVRFIESTT